jgi:hypothetical protein
MTVETFKYYRVVNKDFLAKNDSKLAGKLHSLTGFYPDDYLQPVTQEGGEVVNIVIDESQFRDHYSIALIILPIEYKTPSAIESSLEVLINKYGLRNIHFTEIIGQKSLGDRRDQFLEEFIAIVGPIPKLCFSMSLDIENIKQALGEETPTKEKIYHSLLWSSLRDVIKTLPEYSVFHIHTEQEHSMDGDLDAIGRNYFEKLYGGIEQLSEETDKKFSICKHPHFFSKNALFFSSVADLLAYGGNKLQNKIDKGVPRKKIIKEHKVLLETMKKVFDNLSGMPSPELAEIVSSV